MPLGRPHMKAMPLFPYLLTLLVIFPLAAPATRVLVSRHGLHKTCPTCPKDAKGRGGAATASSDRPGEDSTAALGQGELCGVYTLSCARGLRCNPPPGDPNPLHALLQGRGICNLRSPAAVSPQTTASQPSTPSMDFEKGPCRKQQITILQGLELKIIQSDQAIYIPNCDRRGFYRKKQCHSSRGMQRGQCWCVNETGAEMPSRTAEDGTVSCDTV